MPALTVFASAMAIAASLALLVAIVRKDLGKQGVQPMQWLGLWLLSIVVLTITYTSVIEPLGIYECRPFEGHGYRTYTCR
ncbi:hypothetical protein [Elioraea rosea]|uniref:hypothetical protein n=1 Tax=Elioraea rosea TaxID=2492390 RepID=UPI001186777C|nr:hypothetical protein [Elioraea rosea]